MGQDPGAREAAHSPWRDLVEQIKAGEQGQSWERLTGGGDWFDLCGRWAGGGGAFFLFWRRVIRSMDSFKRFCVRFLSKLLKSHMA